MNERDSEALYGLLQDSGFLLVVSTKDAGDKKEDY